MTCGFDLIDKSEEPEYTHEYRYDTESPVGESEKCPGIIKVLVKRLIGDFNVYSDHYDMMRQLPITQKQYDDVKTRNSKFQCYNF